MSAFDHLNIIAIQYRNQVEECKNFIAWIYLRLNKTEKMRDIFQRYLANPI